MTDLVPHSLTLVKGQVEAYLETFLAEESQRWTGVDPRLGEAIDHLAPMVHEGGKRLRAAFCYWAWAGASGAETGAGPAQDLRVLEACAAFELLQSFALIHDDIMDDSATRRGLPTIHTRQAEEMAHLGWRGEPRRYGEGVAILIGDLAHAYADQLIGTGASAETRRLWDDLRIELNLGQYLDLRSAAAGQLDAETAATVSVFKSARYTIVRPLQLGASVAGPLPEGLATRLEAYGEPLGRAFQLRDDLLGVLASPDRIGKPVGGDLKEGKSTELVAYALAQSNSDQRTTLELIGSSSLSDPQIEEIVDVLHATGAVSEIEQRIDSLVIQASEEAQKLPFPSEVQETLGVLAGYVASRTR